MSDLDYKVGLDGRGFDRGADSVERRSRKLSGALRADFKSAGNGLLGFARTVGVNLPLSVGAAAAAITATLKTVVDSVSELQAQAETAGVKFEAFQELKYAAEQNLIGVDALTDGLKEMQLRADEFIKTSAGPAAEAFSRIGFTTQELADGLKAPDKLFETIIERIKTLDKAAQIRVLDEIFGGTAAEQFQRLMDDASGSLARLRKDAQDLGIVLDEDYLKTVEEINRQWNTMSSVVGTSVKRAVISMTNDVIGLLDKFREISDLSSSKLETQSIEISRKRLDIENKILALQDEQRNAFFSSDQERIQGKIDYLKSEFARLGDIEKRIMAEQKSRRETPSSPPVEFTPLPTPKAGGSGSGKKTLTDIERQQKAVEKLLQDLAFEEAQLRRSSTEQEVYNRLKSVGVDIDSKSGQAIAERVRHLESEKAALEAAKQAEEARKQASESFFNTIGQGLEDVVSNSETAEDALKRVVVQLGLAAAQAALLGTGPLAGLFSSFSGGGGSFVDGGISAMLGYPYHTGGVAGSGGAARSVAATVFASAPRYHDGGIAGLRPGEIPAILRRGEPVDPGDGSVFRKLFGGGNGQTVVVLKLSDDLNARIEQTAGDVADVRIERYDAGGVERTAQNIVEAQARSIL